MHLRRATGDALTVMAFLGVMALPGLAQVSSANRQQAKPAAGQAPASFSGTLLDPTGRALAGVPLTLVESSAGQKHETRTDDNGQFWLTGLTPGDYRIQVSKPAFAEAAGRVILAAGQSLQKDVVPQIVTIQHNYVVRSPGGKGGPGSAPVPGVRTVLNAKVPADPCRATTASGCITPPMRVVEAWPIYPAAAAARGASATVTVTAHLGTDGFLDDFRVAEGAPPEFAAAAIDALKVWEYSPLRLNGIPQQGHLAVTFRFVAGAN